MNKIELHTKTVQTKTVSFSLEQLEEFIVSRIRSENFMYGLGDAFPKEKVEFDWASPTGVDHGGERVLTVTFVQSLDQHPPRRQTLDELDPPTRPAPPIDMMAALRRAIPDEPPGPPPAEENPF